VVAPEQKRGNESGQEGGKGKDNGVQDTLALTPGNRLTRVEDNNNESDATDEPSTGNYGKPSQIPDPRGWEHHESPKDCEPEHVLLRKAERRGGTAGNRHLCWKRAEMVAAKEEEERREQGKTIASFSSHAVHVVRKHEQVGSACFDKQLQEEHHRDSNAPCSSKRSSPKLLVSMTLRWATTPLNAHS
jgi:hypothetical protein